MSSTVQKKAPSASRTTLKVHSIPAWLTGKEFVGEFEVGSTKHNLAFTPSRGELVDKKLALVGALAISGQGGRQHKLPNFQLTLLANQGGIGPAPSRHHHHDLHGVAGVPQDATASHSGEHQSAAQGNLPVTDSTDSRSFCGVMYFRMAPIDGHAMGIAADLSKVQLNLRFAPTIDQERDFQDIYSELVAAVLGKEIDEATARAVLDDLNKALS